MRWRVEFAAVWLLLRVIGVLPRPLAHSAGTLLVRAVLLLHRRLWRVGLRNLEIAFPDLTPKQRDSILRGVCRSLGRQLAEFCRLPDYTKENADQVISYDGLEHYLDARRYGKGVLFLTAHLGGWELGSFAHSLHGYPLHIAVRALDNPYLNRLVDRYRTLHGNATFDKDFARGLVAAMRNGESVGLLMDQNMTPPQGVFVDFFGKPACTAGGLARMALRTGAAVVPVFTIWDDSQRKYRVHFDPSLELVRSGDEERDVVANTAIFTKIIEDYVRRYPDQWLWIHRRWKTRPQGEASLY